MENKKLLKLTELNPKFIDKDPGRHGIAIMFDCPVCKLKNDDADELLKNDEIYCKQIVYFDNPLDKGVPVNSMPGRDIFWHLVNDNSDFNTLSITPSINHIIVTRKSITSHWHGFVTNGEVSIL